MERRKFLTGAGAALATLSPTVAASQSPAQCVPRYDPNFGQLQDCLIGVSNLNMPVQQCPQWCWAACCQAIFEHANIATTQWDFVAKVFGNTNTCLPATGPMMKQAIDGVWQMNNGATTFAQMNVVMDADFGIYHPNHMAVIWNELSNNRAVISGSMGHAVLIHALEYTNGSLGVQTNALHIRDPWPGHPNFGTYTQQQFANIKFLATLQLS